MLEPQLRFSSNYGKVPIIRFTKTSEVSNPTIFSNYEKFRSWRLTSTETQACGRIELPRLSLALPTHDIMSSADCQIPAVIVESHQGHPH